MSRRKRTNRISTADAFSNPAARIGFGTMDLTQAADYPLTRLTENYQLMTSLYRDNWIVQNVVSTIPDDIIRKWYEIKTAIPVERVDELKRLERRLQIRNKIASAMTWGRLYGGAAAVMLIKGQEDMSEPLDPDYVMPDSFQGLLVVDRWSGIYPSGELVDDPGDPDFGLPKYYSVRDEERGMLIANVHHSRVIRFIGRELPWLEQVAETYWGESEIEAVYQEVIKHDNVSANIAALTFRANVNYMESEGIDQLLGTSNVEQQRRFWNTMQAMAFMESNFGMRVINKGDAIHNTQYTFAGIADVYDRIMMDVSGAARIPVTKLFGRSPAGMNATGESDMRNYYDYVDSVRERDFRRAIEKLLPIMAVSTWGAIPDDLDIDFPPMQDPNALEMADIAQKKAATIISAYQTDLLDASEAKQELKQLDEEVGVFGKIADESIEAGKGVTFSSQQAMRDPMMGLFGGDLNAEPDTTAEA